MSSNFHGTSVHTSWECCTLFLTKHPHRWAIGRLHPLDTRSSSSQCWIRLLFHIWLRGESCADRWRNCEYSGWRRSLCSWSKISGEQEEREGKITYDVSDHKLLRAERRRRGLGTELWCAYCESWMVVVRIGRDDSGRDYFPSLSGYWKRQDISTFLLQGGSGYMLIIDPQSNHCVGVKAVHGTCPWFILQWNMALFVLLHAAY